MSLGWIGALVWVLGLLCCGMTIATAEDYRTFSSKNGRDLKARILMVNGDKVHIERADGENFVVPVANFSESDLAFIKRWEAANRGKVPPHLKDRKPKIDIDVSTGKTNKSADNLSGYVDERKQKMAFVIKLINQDAIYPIQDATVTLVVLGKGVEKRFNVVVYREVFDYVNLPYSEEVVLSAKPFELWYDDRGAMYGYKYKAYLVYITEPGGKLLGESMIPAAAVRYLDAIEKLSEGDVYDKNYKKEYSVNVSHAVKR